MYNNKNSNERYKDLCGRLVCWLGETEEGAELYDTLHTEIGMTDDEVSELGFTSLASYFSEHQDKLSATMEEQQLGLRTVAQFRRKEPVLQQDECEIEKVVELTREEFHHFKNNLLDDYDFISENSDLMCVDKMGTIHCILVLGDDYDEGILVNSEGSSYARYSALLPNARSFIEQQMGQESKMTLWQLMSCGLEDVHLVDVDEEHDLATIVKLNQGTLSVAGRSAWSDVLSAKVEGIYNGYYGTQIAVSGCDPQRLADFSFMLAGHCDAEDYDTWVNKHDHEQDIGPVLSM
ncbi:MAG: hypothetical protein IKB22_00995 [Lentisphaeria bacterium]|nr:hypothetical protein [Lentisphaeria bacterium]